MNIHAAGHSQNGLCQFVRLKIAGPHQITGVAVLFVRDWECVSQKRDVFLPLLFQAGDSSLGDSPSAPLA
jgi:hypothetical protein